MSNHTPGPWTAHNNGLHWNNATIDNWTVHYGADQEHIVDHVYEEADARLIAAAPQMLKALRDLDSAWIIDFPLGPDASWDRNGIRIAEPHATLWRSIRGIIAKAERVS